MTIHLNLSHLTFVERLRLCWAVLRGYSFTLANLSVPERDPSQLQ